MSCRLRLHTGPGPGLARQCSRCTAKLHQPGWARSFGLNARVLLVCSQLHSAAACCTVVVLWLSPRLITCCAYDCLRHLRLHATRCCMRLALAPLQLRNVPSALSPWRRCLAHSGWHHQVAARCPVRHLQSNSGQIPCCPLLSVLGMETHFHP